MSLQTCQLRIARPVGDLERSVRMYVEGLGLAVLDSFRAHAGFDGVMLGLAGMPYHFEFTRRAAHPVAPQPTHEDLIVFYLSDHEHWVRTCERMCAAGFAAVVSMNPYWDLRGRTFADADGYRTVLQHDVWSPAPGLIST